jgi:hypothetical protein
MPAISAARAQTGHCGSGPIHPRVCHDEDLQTGQEAQQGQPDRIQRPRGLPQVVAARIQARQDPAQAVEQQRPCGQPQQAGQRAAQASA